MSVKASKIPRVSEELANPKNPDDESEDPGAVVPQNEDSKLAVQQVVVEGEQLAEEDDFKKDEKLELLDMDLVKMSKQSLDDNLEKIYRLKRRQLSESPLKSRDMQLDSLFAESCVARHAISMVEIAGEQFNEIAKDLINGRQETEQKKRELDFFNIKEMINTHKIMTNITIKKMNEARLKSRRNEHLYFADRIFNTLLNFYGIKCPRKEPEEITDVYKPSMGRAVLGICMLYREQWREKFSSLNLYLTNYEDFLKCCCRIPVIKCGPYFYSVLLRVAVIFEMALFCFDYDLDYFEIAIKCVAHFFDVDFFADAGGWMKLQKAADIIYTLTLPLQKVVVCEKRLLKSFSDMITKMIATGALEENSRHFILMKELSENFESEGAAETDVPKQRARKRSTSVSCENDILMNYFKECYPCDSEDSSEKRNWGVREYEMELNCWIYSALDEKYQQKVERVSLGDLGKNLPISKPDTNTKQKSRKSSSEAPNILKEEQGGIACAEPGSLSPSKEVVQKYVPIETDYAEKLMESYKNVLPLFLNTNLHTYFVPTFKSQVFELGKEVVFVAQQSLLKKRFITKLKVIRQKRLWGVSPSGIECVVPLAMERKLDWYIFRNMHRILKSGDNPELLCAVGPDMGTLDLEKCNIWCVKRHLEDLDPEMDGYKEMKIFKSVKIDSEGRSSVVEDFEIVQNFRRQIELVDSSLSVGEEVNTESQIESDTPTEPEPKIRRKVEAKLETEYQAEPEL